MSGLMGGRWKRGSLAGHLRVPGRCAGKCHHNGLVGTQPVGYLYPRQRSTLLSLIQSPKVFKELDQWLRRRLRQVRWKEWKRPKARFRNLRALGLSRNLATNAAGSGKGSWRLSASQPLTIAMDNQYWEKLGLQGFEQCWNRRRLF